MIQQILGALAAMSIVAVLFYYIWVQRQNIAALVQQIVKLGKDLITVRDERDHLQRQRDMMITISRSRVAREKALATFLARPEVVEMLAAYVDDQRDMLEFLEAMEKFDEASALGANLESLLTALEQLGIKAESTVDSVGAS